MNYFKPDKQYYIIPILSIDPRVMIVSDNNRKKLIDHMIESFPLLHSLSIERFSIYVSNMFNTKKTEILEYENLCEFIEIALDKLELPNHILAIGNEEEVKEIVTGRRICYACIENEIYPSTLSLYRVSDCELEKYSIDNYDHKVNNFFYPSEVAKRIANLTIEEFIEKIKTNENKVLKKGMK